MTYIKKLSLMDNSNFVAYDDATNGIVGNSLYSTSGGVDYDFNEAAIEFDSGGSISNING